MQFLKDYGQLIAISVMPFITWFISTKYQERKDKRAQKMRLFLTLVSYRGKPVHYLFVNALNQIEIIFHKEPQIVNAWKKYYDSLALPYSDVINQQRTHLRVNLITEIAKDLGYEAWKQTDIDSFYTPVGHEEETLFDLELKGQLLAYLQEGNKFYQVLSANQEKLNHPGLKEK